MTPLIQHVRVIFSAIQAQVVVSYETSRKDELQLKVGDVVKDIHVTRTRYWSGNLKGKRGRFPKDCVKILLEGVFYSTVYMYVMLTTAIVQTYVGYEMIILYPT